MTCDQALSMQLLWTIWVDLLLNLTEWQNFSEFLERFLKPNSSMKKTGRPNSNKSPSNLPLISVFKTVNPGWEQICHSLIF